MDLTLDPVQLSETLEDMKRLIKFHQHGEYGYPVVMQMNLLGCLFESQQRVKGFRELLLLCKTTSQLFDDEYFHLLGQVDDFLIFVHGEIKSFEKLTAS